MRFSFGVWLRFAAVNVSSHQARAAINGWSLVELELADVCVHVCVVRAAHQGNVFLHLVFKGSLSVLCEC